jgi:hypothetical protein
VLATAPFKVPLTDAVLYDPEESSGGIMLPLSRERKKLGADEYEVGGFVYV